MRKGLIIETLCEVSIVFRKESFVNAKKVLNFKQSLTNKKKVIKSLTAFHINLVFLIGLKTRFCPRFYLSKLMKILTECAQK